ncbi:hypothetical protein [Faecalispora jeddahensis]|uniref:hypothetical protein n=1 Tax=Faecalispora jeddahensis TaxID=1414721 RepID=UPI001897388A|nr:hypothetical protein [Faecalispora jeddahensis]
MEKTDKELAVEFTIQCIQSWNSAERTTPIKPDEAINFLKDTYAALSQLGLTK